MPLSAQSFDELERRVATLEADLKALAGAVQAALHPPAVTATSTEVPSPAPAEAATPPLIESPSDPGPLD